MKHHFFIAVFCFVMLSGVFLHAEPREVAEARKQYEQKIVQAKKLYEDVLDRETASQKKRGNLTEFLELEKELKHTRSEPGAEFSEYDSDNRFVANAKTRYRKEAETARTFYLRKLESLVREYVQAGAIDDAKYVRDFLDENKSGKPVAVKPKKSKGPVFPVIRLAVEIAADGRARCILARGRSNDPVDAGFQGEPFAFSAFPHAEAFRGKQGIGRIVWTFEDPLENWPNSGWGFAHNAKIDLDRNLLVHGLTVPPQDSHFQIFKTASFPVRFSADVVEAPKAGLFLTFWGTTSQGRRGIRVHYWRNPDGTYRIGGEVRKGNKANEIDLVTDLFFANNLKLDEPWGRTFQLSPELAKMTAIETHFNRMSSNGAVSRIDYSAPFTASVGFTVRQQGDKLVVDKIDEKGPAHRAGLLSGDVLETIKGKKMTESEARTVLESGVFGEPVALSVLRNGKSVNVRFHVE